MCGIFGYISKTGVGPSLPILKRIAAETEARGLHAFGLAWEDSEGGIETFKRPGAATQCLDDLNRCRGTRLVIGHCRWATHGSPSNNRNNHPHVAGPGRFVHNGVVRNHRDLVAQHWLEPKTECDTEVIGLLIEQFRGRLVERAAAAVRETSGPITVLGLWANPLRLLVARRDNPLWFSETRGGFWFASQAVGLPGEASTVKNNYVSTITVSGRGLVVDARRLNNAETLLFDR